MHNIPYVVFIWVKLCIYIYIYTYEQHFPSNISHTDILSNIHDKQLHYIYIQMIGSILFVDVDAADNAPNL